MTVKKCQDIPLPKKREYKYDMTHNKCDKRCCCISRCEWVYTTTQTHYAVVMWYNTWPSYYINTHQQFRYGNWDRLHCLCAVLSMFSKGSSEGYVLKVAAKLADWRSQVPSLESHVNIVLSLLLPRPPPPSRGHRGGIWEYIGALTREPFFPLHRVRLAEGAMIWKKRPFSLFPPSGRMFVKPAGLSDFPLGEKRIISWVFRDVGSGQQ